MNIGFVGAGKVGCSLGKHFQMHGLQVAGYFSKSPSSAAEAAAFTKSVAFGSLEGLVETCDAVFLTVPDGQIALVWQQLRLLPLAGKMVCHCSGSLSSGVFDGIEETGACGYSVHPLLAVSDRFASYQELGQALFTVEGSPERLDEACAMVSSCGNVVQVIDKGAKVRYHAAAVVASNLVVGLESLAQDLLVDCGFTPENARMALTPLFLGNAEKVAAMGTEAALTGPVERGDADTVRQHLQELQGQSRELYRLLSLATLDVAQRKHPERDYAELYALLEQASER